MAPFVGKERQGLVDALMARVEALQAGDAVARVVVLEAESGAGKSRVVREFYDRLRQRDGGGNLPPYWPALDEPRRLHGSGTDPLPARKIIGPALQDCKLAGHSIPSFVWWALSCQQFASGEAVKIAADFDDWINKHADALLWAWNVRASNREKVARQRDNFLESATEALQEGGVEAAGQILTQLGIPTMGLGWLLAQVGKVRNTAAEWHRLHDALTHEVAVEPSEKSKAREIAGRLKRVARPDLPVIVVVEDAHLLGADLAELLTVLAEPDPRHPVLVVATAWPEGRLHPAWAGWLARQKARGTAEMWPVGRLTGQDLGALLRANAPTTDDAITREVVARWTNPLALELLLTWSRVAERIADNDGALTLTAQELADLPTDVLGMYEARWGTLPTLMRQVLSATRATLPVERGTEPFLRSVIAAAAVGANLVDVWGEVGTAVVDGQLGQAHEFGWLTELDAGDAFTEAPLADIAFDRMAAELGRRAPTTVIPTLRTAVAEELAERILRARGAGYLLPPGDSSLALACDWLLDIVEGDGVSEANALAVTLARLDRARREAAVYNYRHAIVLTQQALAGNALIPDHPDTLTVRGNLAAWLAETGQVDEAVDQLRALLDDVTRVLGPDHHDTLATRGNLLSSLAEAGQVDEAVDQLRALLDDITRVHGPDHPDTLATRGNLAGWLAESGQVDEAVDKLRALLDDITRVLGPDHANTLRIRGNLAHALGESGHVDDAVTDFRALLDESTRVLGPDHPDTLTTRQNLAHYLGESGHADEAVAQLRALLDDITRVLGPDHPDTLTTRQNLADCLGESGQLDVAVAQLRAVLDDITRVLGPDHPDTLTTRHSLAYWLAKSGHVDEAVAQFRALLDDITRVLGPDHPGTLTTRGNLASWLAESGRIDESITELREVLVDRTRVLGPDHPGTLATRHNLAHWLAESGHADEAVAQLRALLRDRTRVLGPDHPATLTARTRLAYQLLNSRRADEATIEFQALLDQITRRQGPDHPATEAVRKLLGSIQRGASGARGDAGADWPVVDPRR